MPKKEPKQIRVKDPKKVLAGKARAAKSLRVDGKFTSNSFFERIKKDADFNQVKDVFAFFLQREKKYTTLYYKEQLGTTKNEDQFLHAIENYKGKVICNGKEITRNLMREEIRLMGIYLRTEQNAVTFHTDFSLRLEGKLNLRFPTIDEIKSRLEGGEKISGILKEFGITIIASDKTKKLS